MTDIKRPTFVGLPKEEWLTKRRQYLTATDIPCLFSLNPFKTLKKVREIKFGGQLDDIIDMSYVSQGLEWEPTILQYAAEKLQAGLVHTQGFYTDEEARIGATPDAVLSNNHLVEAKCTGIKNFEKWQNNPPLHYIMQTQVQLLLTGAEKAHLVIFLFNYWPEDPKHAATAIVEITPSEEIFKKILDKSREFWNNEGVVRFATRKEKEDMVNLLKENSKVTHAERTANTEIAFAQLRIIRQTCLEQATRLTGSYEVDEVLARAQSLENLLTEIVKDVGDNTREFYIELSSCLKRAVDLALNKPRHLGDTVGSNEDLQDTIYKCLLYITNFERK